MKPPELYLIGLTGGIACGKSSVVTMLEELGAWTLDADDVTRRLQQPGMPVYREIVHAFGSDILLWPDGPLDRAKLGERVFRDPQALRRLEQIVHPAVRIEVTAWLAKVVLWAERGEGTAAQSAAPRLVTVLDAIKLLEGGWKQHCDAVWVVTCSTAQQIERLVQQRGMSEAEARQRIEAQPSQESRTAQADVVIDNSGSLDHTRQQVDAAWQDIMSGQ
jgi:dephospho-CoA kinase